MAAETMPTASPTNFRLRWVTWVLRGRKAFKGPRVPQDRKAPRDRRVSRGRSGQQVPREPKARKAIPALSARAAPRVRRVLKETLDRRVPSDRRARRDPRDLPDHRHSSALTQESLSARSIPHKWMVG